MKITRRDLMAGAGAASLSSLLPSNKLNAWPRHGASSSYPIGTGWNVLPFGCGGFVTGMVIANDRTMYCRTDVGNAYRFSGITTDYANPAKVWVPLMNRTSLAGQGPAGGQPRLANFAGAWEIQCGPNNSDTVLAIFADMQQSATLGWVWYSTNGGALWNKSNLSFDNDTTNSNAGMKFAQQKIAIDPANPNIAYCGCPYNDGNSAGAYTTLNKSGGSTLSTWTSVKTSGSTPIPDTALASSWRSNSISAGLAFDPTSGTTTIGGQTVTNRIIIPISGSGIYESTDGGNTFAECAVSHGFGTSDFYVIEGKFTAEGIYYCIAVSTTAYGVWRYKSGTWTNVSTTYAYNSYGSYVEGGTYLIVDPRNNSTSKAYLSVFGPNGFGIGFTCTDANTTATTWTGSTGGQVPTMNSSSEIDIGYIDEMFGGAGPGTTGPYYTAANGTVVDPDGVCWWPGNQSLFYVGVSDADSTPAVGPPTYVSAGGDNDIASWSMGRGMEVTVAEEAMVAPGGVYPVIAVQDCGSPMRGTFTTYPNHMAAPYQEWTCECVEYAASDPAFTVARITGQNGAHSITDDSKYSTTYGSDLSWTPLYTGYYTVMLASISAAGDYGSSGNILEVTSLPDGGTISAGQFVNYGSSGSTYLGVIQAFGTGGTTGTGGTGTYQLSVSSLIAAGTKLYACQSAGYNQVPKFSAAIVAGISNGSGGSGVILNVTSILDGGKVRETAFITAQTTSGGSYYGVVQPYGTGGTTGTGGTGTYQLDTSSFVAPGTTIYSTGFVQGGVTVAVDHDHWVTIPAGYGGQSYIPQYTTNATGTTTWADCAGLTAQQWVGRGWAFGPTTKPLAVGYGADLGTVWLCKFPPGTTDTAYLYRSTDSGASFSLIHSWTVGIAVGCYCLSVPGFPNELWISGHFVAGSGSTKALWHVTDANTASPTFTKIALANNVVSGIVEDNVEAFTLGAPATPGGYPTLYAICNQGGGAADGYTTHMYEGQVSGGANNPSATVTWSVFGPTGTVADLPPTLTLNTVKAIRGDWNVYQRIYGAAGGSGLAYYNP